MRLLEKLRDPALPLPTGLAPIRAWRLYLEERQELEAALRRGQVGGPYTPPSFRSQAVGEVFVQWADGLCNQAVLNRSQLEHADETLLGLRAQAFPDPFPEHVPGHAEPAPIRVCVPEVKDAIHHSPDALMRPVRHLAQELRRVNSDQVRGQLHARHSLIHFATSEGAYSSHEATRVSYGGSIAGRSAFVHELRDLPDEVGLLTRVARVRQDYDDLNRPFTGLLSAPKVLLAPSLTRRFLDYYLRSNLSMQAVLNGASAFTRQDIEEERLLFHPSITITDHPLRDDHPSAFRLCQRGQSPLERPLILDGRLKGTDVSLRAATQGGLPPTPTSLTDNWIFASDGSPPPLDPVERALLGVEEAILIYAVLGLHTQDPVRGDYSVGVPRAMVVRDGRIEGFVRGTMIGNFFQDLSAPLATWADPLQDAPILAISATFIQG